MIEAILIAAGLCVITQTVLLISTMVKLFKLEDYVFRELELKDDQIYKIQERISEELSGRANARTTEAASRLDNKPRTGV